MFLYVSAATKNGFMIYDMCVAYVKLLDWSAEKYNCLSLFDTLFKNAYFDVVHFPICAGRWSSIDLTHKKWMYIALGLFFGNSSLECFHFRTWQQYRQLLQLWTKMFAPSYPMTAYLFSAKSWQDAGIPTLILGHHSLKL